MLITSNMDLEKISPERQSLASRRPTATVYVDFSKVLVNVKHSYLVELLKGSGFG